MKTISAGLLAHLAQPTTTLATCLILTRNDGVILRATNHDQDLIIGGQTYYAVGGGTATDVQSSSAMNVDNSEHHGLYGLVTEANLAAGLYDNAVYSRFVVNYSDLTQGSYSQQDGKTGQFTLDRLSFVAELRGLLQALQQSFGRTCTPSCPYILGDAECTKSLVAFTVTGTLDSVSANGVTLYDAARAEAGPAGGIAIVSISNANPCVIVLASVVGLPSGSTMTLSGILGPAALNGVVTILNVAAFQFEIAINTTDTAVYPAYTGSGVATPMGAESGYFDYGLLTITSGTNAGISREIKSFVPGQLTMQEPFPFTLAGTETYTAIAGCDKTPLTCRVKFSNKVNFGGDEFVRGMDSIAQVGRNE